MRKERRTKEQCVALLQTCMDAVTAGGETVASWCRKNNISTASVYQWRTRYGARSVGDAREIKTVSTEKTLASKMLATENLRLRSIVADLMLDKQALLEYTGRK